MADPAHIPELPWIWAGIVLLLAATATAYAELVPGGASGVRPARVHRAVLGFLGLALAALTVGLAVRWQRLGHGPFLTMFEILASNLWSLSLAWSLAHWRIARVRTAALVVLPILALLGLWLVRTNPADTVLPPTYDTVVLWFHVLLGKAFFGCTVVAVGLAGIILLRRRRAFAAVTRTLPDDALLDQLAWQFMQVAVVFETLMLIAGALWAQDAWGRYWAWDPLETWAFLTWLVLSAAIHARTTWRIAPQAGALLILAVFVLAFTTFFGIPFVSTAPHKGAV